MRKILKYKIPTNKVWYDRKGKAVPKRSGTEIAATPRAKSLGTAIGPKKSTKPTSDSSKPKRVNKLVTISKRVVIPEGRPVFVSTMAAPTKVTELGNELAEVPEKEISTTASVAPTTVAELGKESAEASEKESPTAPASAVHSKVAEIGKEIPATSPGTIVTEIAQPSVLDVIHIEDEPEEPEKEV